MKNLAFATGLYIFALSNAALAYSLNLGTAIWNVKMSSQCPFKGERVFVKLGESSIELKNLTRVEAGPNQKYKFSWETLSYVPEEHSSDLFFMKGWSRSADGSQVYIYLDHKEGSKEWEFRVGESAQKALKISIIDSAYIILTDRNNPNYSCELTNNNYFYDTIMAFFNALPVASEESLLNYFDNARQAHEMFAVQEPLNRFHVMLKDVVENKRTHNGTLIYLYLLRILNFDEYDTDIESQKKILIPFISKMTTEQKVGFAQFLYHFDSSDLERDIFLALLDARREDLLFQIFPFKQDARKGALGSYVMEAQRYDLLESLLISHRNDPRYFGGEDYLIMRTFIYNDWTALKLFEKYNFLKNTQYNTIKYLCFLAGPSRGPYALEFIQFLIDSGVPIEPASFYECSPLFRSVLSKQYAALDLLVKNHVNVNYRSGTGHTALFVSFVMEDFVAIQKLIDAGADRSVTYQFDNEFSKPMTICELLPLAYENVNRSKYPHLPWILANHKVREKYSSAFCL